jgi:anti-anti-sigma factor
MPLSYTKTENVLILYPTGRLDLEQSAFLEREIENLLSKEAGSNFLINMAGVDYINSYGLRIIIKTYMDLRDEKRILAICNINNAIRKLLDVIGRTDMFEVFDSEAEGVDYLR